MLSPTIVVVAYNRHESLTRLLKSLLVAEYPDENVRLVISIDYSDNDKVAAVASDFQWRFGEKIIIKHEKNLGLRRHVISCGDLSKHYGPVIMLEDDLYVSPLYYRYASQCLLHYADEEIIAGISLYNHRTNVNCYLPFEPIDDGSDVYYLQFASSWGQAWSPEQWAKFKHWYEAEHRNVTSEDFLPDCVINWPESSWLKFYIKYMVENKRYFVYPRTALSTNCSDPGTHNRNSSNLFQVPLLAIEPDHKWRFSNISTAFPVYDSFFELKESSLKRANRELEPFSITVDLYGTKPFKKILTPYVLSCRSFDKPTLSFDCSLKPRDANVIFGVRGDRLHLVNVQKNHSVNAHRPHWEQEYCANGPSVKNTSLARRIARWLRRTYRKKND